MGGGRRGGGRSEKRGGRRASGKKSRKKGGRGKNENFARAQREPALSREEGDKGREGR